MAVLTPEQIATFNREGYLVFENFFTEEERQGCKEDIDLVEKERKAGINPSSLVGYPHLGPLICNARIMQIVEDLMGADFTFNHLHATRQDAGSHGVNWHQDYEQIPQSDRDYLMIHLFYYFDGLNGEVGDLLVLPRSQSQVVSNSALWMLQTIDLPGSLTINSLPPGSMVLVNSALWHARRPKPGGDNHPRYFADASYCQGGILWPSYGVSNWREILAQGKAQGLDGHGRYPALLDESRFFDSQEAYKLLRKIPGSLVVNLKEWKE